MLSNGLVISSFKRYTNSKKRGIVKVCRPVDLSESDRITIRDIVLEDFLRQIEYDTRAIIKFIFKKLGKNERKKMYCSEHCYTRLNMVLRKHKQNITPQVSPADLASGDLFSLEEIEWVL